MGDIKLYLLFLLYLLRPHVNDLRCDWLTSLYLKWVSYWFVSSNIVSAASSLSNYFFAKLHNIVINKMHVFHKQIRPE